MFRESAPVDQGAAAVLSQEEDAGARDGFQPLKTKDSPGRSR
jgi:hypothetical protein